MKFEGAKPSLKPWEFFVISIFLVFIVALTLVVAYYNMFLAYRNRPPFKVCKIFPQVLIHSHSFCLILMKIDRLKPKNHTYI